MVRFGTDGVRGESNVDLTPSDALRLGTAAARVLGRGRWLVGRDTRRSGSMFEAALAAGLAAEGAEVELLGVLPTPGVASLCQHDGVAGAVISASHNPFHDNGIKFFGPGGRKLSDEVQTRIEAELHGADGPRARGVDVGTVTAVDGAVDRYVTSLIERLPGASLEGLVIVLDCANGAASTAAPEVFARLGAELVVLHAEPDGCNINEQCGSTHPESLRAAVIDNGAHLGLAFDGDADRVVAVDRHGDLVDGDQIILACARDLQLRGRLRNDAVAVTVMANLGLRLALTEAGIGIVETPVGDRYVLEALDDHGLVLGGEQSGHVVFRDLATTGDGILTGLVLTDLLRRSGRPLHQIAALRRYPQILRSVRVDGSAHGLAEAMGPAVEAEVRALGDEGRVVVRASGTEPVLRIMVEATSPDMAEEVVERLVRVATGPSGS